MFGNSAELEKAKKSLNYLKHQYSEIINQYSESPPLTEGSPLLRLVSCKVNIFYMF